MAAAARVAASCCRSWQSVGGDGIVKAMAKHSETSGKIWRTVVFAGAMLAAPIGCGASPKAGPVQPDQAAADKAAADQKLADDKAVSDKATADKAAADQKVADDKVAADKAAADQAAAVQKAKDDQTAADAAAKKRPRGGGGRPTGRGFVLA